MEHSYNIEDRQNFSGLATAAKKKRDIGKTLNSLPLWTLFVLILTGYTLMLEIGNYIGYQRFLGGIKNPTPPTDAAVGSVLALMAFLLGFTFSSSWTRFIRRNGSVLAHAKAIQTCYLRTSLITEVQKMEVRRLLQEYTAVLLTLQTKTDLESVLPRIDEIHLMLWKQTASLAKKDIDSELRSLFTASVNDLISVAMERKTIALFIRIPIAIWNSLLLLAAISMAAFGYQAGVEGISKLFQIPLLPVAFALVMVLIADLNSKESKGQFRVTRRPLREVLEMMGKPIL